MSDKHVLVVLVIRVPKRSHAVATNQQFFAHMCSFFAQRHWPGCHIGRRENAKARFPANRVQAQPVLSGHQ